MKTFLLRTSLMMILTINLSGAFAKVWRVNKTPGITADFVELSTAAANAAVQSGDTIHVEGAPSAYTNFTLYKKLVIIGPGYFLSGAFGNPGLQANTNSASISIMLDTLSSGTQLIGLEGNVYLDSRVDNISIVRCNMGVYANNSYANSAVQGLRLHQSFLSISFSAAYRFENFQITNSILYNIVSLPNSYNGLIRNNVISNITITVTDSYVSNNIFFNSAANLVNCTVRYNISTLNNTLPAGNNNQNNIPSASLFVGTGSTDGIYALKAGSPAIGAGEPVNGVTPDAGIFGTADPYRLSGIAPIPSIYQLTVPASVATTATTMPVTVSTRSNN
jgi:hypothetical protein